MEQTYAGELRLLTGPPPAGWMTCDGQSLPVSQYPALFAAIGVTYGGDGVNFALPDMRASVALGAGLGYPLGAVGGQGTVTLEIPQIPTHLHNAMCSPAAGSQPTPVGGVWAASSLGEAQYSASATGAMAGAALQAAGTSAAHPNMQPYLALSWAIALGLPPS
jgi:microcystin-dependent protein